MLRVLQIHKTNRQNPSAYYKLRVLAWDLTKPYIKNYKNNNNK